jgi:hypothetical protein
MNGLQKGAIDTSNGSDVSAIEIIKNERPNRTCIIVSFLLIRNLNGYDGANDAEDYDEDDEANPALSACRSCRGDSLFCVAKTTGPVRTLPQKSKARTHPVSTSFSTSVA